MFLPRRPEIRIEQTGPYLVSFAIRHPPRPTNRPPPVFQVRRMDFMEGTTYAPPPEPWDQHCRQAASAQQTLRHVIVRCLHQLAHPLALAVDGEPRGQDPGGRPATILPRRRPEGINGYQTSMTMLLR